jgi:hypothetical protein
MQVPSHMEASCRLRPAGFVAMAVHRRSHRWFNCALLRGRVGVSNPRLLLGTFFEPFQISC